MSRVFACSDLHGMYNLWEKIKEYCKEDDTIYFLGDAADRGSDGVRIMQELLADPRVIYLCGNHEDMLSLLWHYPSRNAYIEQFIDNGGSSTFNDFFKLSPDERDDLINKIDNLPVYTYYINKNNKIIHLTHAGLTPGTKEEYTENDLIWDRNHIIDKWWGKDNEIVVHGHTPVSYLNTYACMENKIFKDNEIGIYCGGHKIDIDLESFTTNITILLDLDSLKPIYIKG